KVAASDKSQQVIIAGAVAGSLSGSAVGVSVTINTITNKTSGYIDGSNVKSDHGSVKVSSGWDTADKKLYDTPHTFDPSTAVDTSSDWITLQEDPGYKTGDAVIYDKGDGTELGKLNSDNTQGTLTNGGTYYVIVDPNNHKRIRLAETA